MAKIITVQVSVDGFSVSFLMKLVMQRQNYSSWTSEAFFKGASIAYFLVYYSAKTSIVISVGKLSKNCFIPQLCASRHKFGIGDAGSDPARVTSTILIREL